MLTNLALTDSVAEHHQFLRLPPIVGLVELHQQVLGGVLHVPDHLLVVIQAPVLERQNYNDNNEDLPRSLPAP